MKNMSFFFSCLTLNEYGCYLLCQKIAVVEVSVSEFDIICDVNWMKGNNGMNSILKMGQLFIHILCFVTF